ncbi:hypothetical protein [Muribaculum sp.]|uniref:hypothetical protein n=1 Tax=Muribaculum sp. TaxID=1918611 RepID=UPI00261321F2|nr:hypothetical protein [Muribaculum sp.]
MARGKQTCKILKEIRRRIAEANGIEFGTSECRYKGDCLGTCPKCEAEVRYLEQQLRARSLARKAITLAGISAGMIIMSGCSGTTSKNQSSVTLQGEPVAPIEQVEVADTIDEGELPPIEDTVIIKKGEIDDTEYPVVGEIIDPEQEDKVYEAIIDVRPTFTGGDFKKDIVVNRSCDELLSELSALTIISCDRKNYGKKGEFRGNVWQNGFRIALNNYYWNSFESQAVGYVEALDVRQCIVHLSIGPNPLVLVVMCFWNLCFLVALIAASISAFSVNTSKGFAALILFLPFIAVDVLFLRYALYSNYKKLKVRLLELFG